MLRVLRGLLRGHGRVDVFRVAVIGELGAEGRGGEDALDRFRGGDVNEDGLLFE